MKRERRIEQVYPNEAARKVADKAVDGLSVEESMLKHMVVWEEAYLEAGGTVRL